MFSYTTTTGSRYVILFLTGFLFFGGSFVSVGVWFSLNKKTALAQEALIITSQSNYSETLDGSDFDFKLDNIETTVVYDEPELSNYVEVIDGCATHYEGECLRVRSGPGTDYDVVGSLRNNIVLKVEDIIENEGRTWYKIIFDEWLRYPERVKDDWYVSSEFVRIFLDEGESTVWTDAYATSSKKIIINLSSQTLTALEDDEVFMTVDASTGLQHTPTPLGTFSVYKKTPSRYMQGPLPNLSDDQYYDLPGVPWNLYFTDGGAVIHGAYWHENFGEAFSHGCVNLLPEEAKKLYRWANLGMKVVVIK